MSNVTKLFTSKVPDIIIYVYRSFKKKRFEMLYHLYIYVHTIYFSDHLLTTHSLGKGDESRLLLKESLKVRITFSPTLGRFVPGGGRRGGANGGKGGG